MLRIVLRINTKLTLVGLDNLNYFSANYNKTDEHISFKTQHIPHV